MAIDLKKIRGEVAATAPDLTKPSAGGDFADRIPAEGPTRLRLVSYIETGIHTTKWQGAPKRKPRAEIGFELSGPKHEPRKLDDGTVIPYRIAIKETIGTTPRNGYMKLFNILNAGFGGGAKNFVDMLMEGAWRGTVSHYKFKGNDGQERVIAQLKSKEAGIQIAATEFSDPETGELRKVSVAPAVSELRLFLWDYPDLEQWDSLKIEGTRDDGSSKNFIQDKIRAAENFVGSPIYNLLIESGRKDEAIPLKADAAEEEDETGAPAGDAKPAGASLDEGVAPETPAAKPATKAAAKPKAAPKQAAKAQTGADNSDPLAGV